MADTDRKGTLKSAMDRKDEYDGKYKPNSAGMGPQELWGTTQNPVKETPKPYKGLKDSGSGQGNSSDA
mgnify:CR=1 FL=1